MQIIKQNILLKIGPEAQWKSQREGRKANTGELTETVLILSSQTPVECLTSPQCFLASSSRRDFNKLTLSFDKPLAFFNSISGILKKKKTNIKRSYLRKASLFALIFAEFPLLLRA
jgi:hypothetical protein